MLGCFKKQGLVLLATLGLTCSALAAYPDKPIRLVVPFPPGGAADIMARGMAVKLGQELGQPIVIDNRGGAGGSTASELVAKSPADGYTILFANMGTMAINVSLYPNLRYDPVKDFAPVSLTHLTPRVLMVSPDVPANSIAELIALAKKNPGMLSYGSAGNGSSSHISGALFGTMAGVEMLHIPYKGSAPLVTDLLAGRVNMTFDSYSVYENHIRNGKVKVLGVTAPKRMDVLPAAPTIAESGLKGYEVLNWLGLVVPTGTPPEVIKRLNEATAKAMADTELRKQLIQLGIEPTHSTPEQFSALILTEIPKWKAVVSSTGATNN
jgi:tripartite-type tricarboxylate transporter receptor subunit TctC